MAYWLFKSEPDEFGITDLAREEKVCWDGIRNYQARNNLRDQVAPGDLVFFYHSGCRVPGIAGLAEVVSEPYPDPTQFNPEHKGHDPKSGPDNPRWYAVDLAHRRTFHPLLPGRELKTLPPLRDMVLFRQGRLSVQPVTPGQWRTILALCDGDKPASGGGQVTT